MKAWTEPSVRTLLLRIALLLPLVTAFPLAANAQTADPRVVEFQPSSDHDTVVNNTPVVARYALEFYTLGQNALLQSIDLGKPSPDPDGFIRAEFASRLGGWPAAGVVYEARVVAIGPGGAGSSAASNQFAFPSAPPPAPPPPAQCSFSLSQTARTVGNSAASGSFDVWTGDGCSWTAASSAGWLTVSGAASRTGSSAVWYSVQANSANSVRMASIQIGSASFVLTQNGGCSYTLTPTSQGFNAPGGTATVTVTTASACTWTATRSGSWITILSGGTGTGNGTVSYRVSANGGSTKRTGTLTIAGQPVAITQSAATAPNAPAGLRIVIVR